MSLTALVLLMAVAGAALFAAAGFLFAKARIAGQGGSPSPSYELSDEGDGSAREALEALRQQLAAAEGEAAARAAELAQCSERAEQFQTAHAALQAESSRAQSEHARLQSEHARLQAEVGRLQAELAAARITKVAAPDDAQKTVVSSAIPSGLGGGASEDELALRTQLVKAEAKVNAAEQREKQASADLVTVRKGLEVAGNNLAARDQELQRSQKDLTRVRAELEKACDEIAGLRLERTRAEQANAARLALEKELKQLKATQFAATAAGAKPLKNVDLDLKGGSSGGALEDLVHRVQSQGQYESVAIADELGLTAAGVGPHIDELAAFTSLLLGVSARASRFFPMQDFGYATLTDAHGISIEARPVAGTSGFVLLTLGAGQAAEVP